MKNNKPTIIIVSAGILASIALLAIYFFYAPEAAQEQEKILEEDISTIAPEEQAHTTSETIVPVSAEKNAAVNKDEPKKEPVSLRGTENVTVLFGKDTLYLSVFKETTFYDALVEARGAGKVEFSGKNYPGLGFFVTDIGMLHSGDGKDLLYYVNGKEATVGVSLYRLKDGDTILWKLE